MVLPKLRNVNLDPSVAPEGFKRLNRITVLESLIGGN